MPDLDHLAHVLRISDSPIMAGVFVGSSSSRPGRWPSRWWCRNSYPRIRRWAVSQRKPSKMVTTTYPIHDRHGHVIGHCNNAADAMHLEAYERSVEVRVVQPWSTTALPMRAPRH